MKQPRQIKWDVYFRGAKINSVFFTPDCDKEYVLKALINHDGFHPDIKIKEAAK
jgi:hypothetical protein